MAPLLGRVGMFDRIRRRRGGRDRVVARWRVAIGRWRTFPGERELFAGGFGLALAVPHARVKSVARQEALMGAALDDLALIEHDDLVGADDRREPMRDHQRGAISGNPLESV